MDTPSLVAGFETAGSGATDGDGSVDTCSAMAGFGGHSDGWPPRLRTAIPTARRYALAVSRRTPVADWIRRSVQPRRPSATTCCFLSSPKTLAIPAVDLVGEHGRDVTDVPATQTTGKRGHQKTVVSGGIVPPETLASNDSHPYRHIPEARRTEVALQALGALV